MSREQIQSVVLRHLARSVDRLDAASVDPTRSMKEYGANSLDIVEVVSASMRELKIKIPRAELAGITNIDGLVDALFVAAQAKGL